MSQTEWVWVGCIILKTTNKYLKMRNRAILTDIVKYIHERFLGREEHVQIHMNINIKYLFYLFLFVSNNSIFTLLPWC